MAKSSIIFQQFSNSVIGITTLQFAAIIVFSQDRSRMATRAMGAICDLHPLTSDNCEMTAASR